MFQNITQFSKDKLQNLIHYHEKCYFSALQFHSIYFKKGSVKFLLLATSLKIDHFTKH